MLSYIFSYFFPFFSFYLFKKYFSIYTINYPFYFFTFIFFTILVGLRNEVGGDWSWYIFTQLGPNENNLMKSFFEIPKDESSDIGYLALSHFSLKMGLGIYGVNFLCASILIYALIKFSNSQPLPWITLMIAFPYIIVIVGMGYVRQATALGFGILSILALTKNNFKFYVINIIFATIFHKTAIFFLIYIFGINILKNKYYIILALVFFTISILVFQDRIMHLIYYYIGPGQYMESSGFLYRYILNLIPAIIFLFYYKSLELNIIEINIYLINSLIILSLSIFIFIAPVFLDRISIYLTTIQLLLYSRLILIFNNILIRNIIILAIILFYLIYLISWFIFANFSNFWMPYDNLLFYSLF